MIGGDFVIVPSESGKKVSIGLIRSEAIEQPEALDSYVAIRNVLWLTVKSPISNLPTERIAFLGSPKTIVKTKKYLAHDELGECNIGDQVLVEECRPLSRRKRWKLNKIISKSSLVS